MIYFSARYCCLALRSSTTSVSLSRGGAPGWQGVGGLGFLKKNFCSKIHDFRSEYHAIGNKKPKKINLKGFHGQKKVAAKYDFFSTRSQQFFTVFGSKSRFSTKIRFAEFFLLKRRAFLRHLKYLTNTPRRPFTVLQV